MAMKAHLAWRNGWRWQYSKYYSAAWLKYNQPQYRRNGGSINGAQYQLQPAMA
jgi:hypothetical protein